MYGASAGFLASDILGCWFVFQLFLSVPSSHVFLFLVHSFRVGARQECGFPCIERVQLANRFGGGPGRGGKGKG